MAAGRPCPVTGSRPCPGDQEAVADGAVRKDATERDGCAVWSRYGAILDEPEQRDRVLEDRQTLEPDDRRIRDLDGVLGGLAARTPMTVMSWTRTSMERSIDSAGPSPA